MAFNTKSINIELSQTLTRDQKTAAHKKLEKEFDADFADFKKQIGRDRLQLLKQQGYDTRGQQPWMHEPQQLPANDCSLLIPEKRSIVGPPTVTSSGSNPAHHGREIGAFGGPNLRVIPLTITSNENGFSIQKGKLVLNVLGTPVAITAKFGGLKQIYDKLQQHQGDLQEYLTKDLSLNVEVKVPESP